MKFAVFGLVIFGMFAAYHYLIPEERVRKNWLKEAIVSSFTLTLIYVALSKLFF